MGVHETELTFQFRCVNRAPSNRNNFLSSAKNKNCKPLILSKFVHSIYDTAEERFLAIIELISPLFDPLIFVFIYSKNAHRKTTAFSNAGQREHIVWFRHNVYGNSQRQPLTLCTDDEKVHNFSFFSLSSIFFLDFVLSVAFHLCDDVGKFEFVNYIVEFCRLNQKRSNVCGMCCTRTTISSNGVYCVGDKMSLIADEYNDIYEENYDKWPCAMKIRLSRNFSSAIRRHRRRLVHVYTLPASSFSTVSTRQLSVFLWLFIFIVFTIHTFFFWFRNMQQPQ